MSGLKKKTVLGVEEIEDGLMGMGRLIEVGGPWNHPEMDRIPEWRGADVRITSDFEREFNEPGYFDHDLTVRTRHAGPVTWFIFQMRDLFDGWLDWGNKYGFYELLAQAALEHLAANQPEPEDARPILRAMLTRAFLILEVAKEHHASQEIEDGIWKIGSGGRWKVECGKVGTPGLT